jgi:hypothetical protein
MLHRYMLVALSIVSFTAPSAGAQESNGSASEEWAIWYVDTFDREMPPRIEVSGRGLVSGLAELWARHMFETVRPEGSQGFSSFDLRWRHGRVAIGGDREGARRIRGWLFGSTEISYDGYVERADRELLEKLAVAHAHFIELRQTAEPILTMAGTAADRSDFLRRLDDAVGS